MGAIGNNIEEASKPFIFEIEKIRSWDLLLCWNTSFSIVSSYSMGANPIDLWRVLDHIQNLKQVDYVIVLYHGGKEHYR